MVKNDEFYTRLPDIKKELKYYRKYFKNKVVYCNCDDPFVSQFFYYFFKKFHSLGLKKLVATHYRKPTQWSLSLNRGTKVEYNGEKINGKRPKLKDLQSQKLKGNGDFRNPECIDILKQADIVVTNPPFSLFGPHIMQLVEYGKKFLLIGNMTSLGHPPVFPLVADNSVWLGMTNVKKFTSPKGDIQFGNTRWYTNLGKNRKKGIKIKKSYYKDPEKYPKYDNYDAIEVSHVKNIPKDYKGIMGVPVTIFDSLNPKQFKVLGLSETGYNQNVPPTKDYLDYWEVRPDDSVTGGNGVKTTGIAMLKGRPKMDKNYYINQKGDLAQAVFARVFIRNKNPKPRKDKK